MSSDKPLKDYDTAEMLLHMIENKKVDFKSQMHEVFKETKW